MSNTIITIARSYGSGGRIIGKKLAEEMNIPYYDRNLIYLAASKTGIDLKHFSENDEDVRRGIFSNIIPSENRKYVSRDDIYHYQADIIKDVADESDCVIVGRCADHILKNSKHNIIRIFIWANREVCINTVTEKFAVSEAEAVKMIKQIDRHRYDYYKYHTSNDWDSAKNYDLCFDTSKLSYEYVVHIIKEYIKTVRKINE